MKSLLTSRKFWAAVITLVVVIVSSVSAEHADLEMDADSAAGLVVIAVSYIIGVAVDPGPGGWRGIVQSRKFWAAVVGFLIMTLDAFHLVLPFALSTEQLVTIALTIGGYIAGVAFEKQKTSASA